jgi:hypothetical protein
MEWGQRLTGGGGRLGYAPAAVVAHRPRSTARATWRLHRRLGAGWAQLAARGLRPPPREDPALHVGFQWVVEMVDADGGPVPRWQLRAVHRFVKAARWTGRLTARP